MPIDSRIKNKIDALHRYLEDELGINVDFKEPQDQQANKGKKKRLLFTKTQAQDSEDVKKGQAIASFLQLVLERLESLLESLTASLSGQNRDELKNNDENARELSALEKEIRLKKFSILMFIDKIKKGELVDDSELATETLEQASAGYIPEVYALCEEAKIIKTKIETATQAAQTRKQVAAQAAQAAQIAAQKHTHDETHDKSEPSARPRPASVSSSSDDGVEAARARLAQAQVGLGSVREHLRSELSKRFDAAPDNAQQHQQPVAAAAAEQSETGGFWKRLWDRFLMRPVPAKAPVDRATLVRSRSASTASDVETADDPNVRLRDLQNRVKKFQSEVKNFRQHPELGTTGLITAYNELQAFNDEHERLDSLGHDAKSAATQLMESLLPTHTVPAPMTITAAHRGSDASTSSYHTAEDGEEDEYEEEYDEDADDSPETRPEHRVEAYGPAGGKSLIDYAYAMFKTDAQPKRPSDYWIRAEEAGNNIYTADPKKPDSFTHLVGTLKTTPASAPKTPDGMTKLAEIEFDRKQKDSYYHALKSLMLLADKKITDEHLPREKYKITIPDLKTREQVYQFFMAYYDTVLANINAGKIADKLLGSDDENADILCEDENAERFLVIKPTDIARAKFYEFFNDPDNAGFLAWVAKNRPEILANNKHHELFNIKYAFGVHMGFNLEEGEGVGPNQSFLAGYKPKSRYFPSIFK